VPFAFSAPSKAMDKPITMRKAAPSAGGIAAPLIAKRNRPWKAPRAEPTSALRNGAGQKVTWERRQRQREERKALLVVVRAAKEEDDAAKDAERKRRYEKRKRKEENALRSAKKVIVSNPKKLARMSKKQFLHAVHKK
jgi:Cgr1 family